MNIVDRLKIYMEHTGLPISQFADAALIPRPTLSQILSGRNKKISNEVLEKLHDAFPELNVAWLLFGDGEMTKGGANASAPTMRQSVPANQGVAQPPEHNVHPTVPLDGDALKELAMSKPDSSAINKKEPQIALAPDANKKIQTIMVFYTDNSFEIFTPSQR